MHSANWDRKRQFDFGSWYHRDCLRENKECTFGHYKVGEGVITIVGVLMDGTILDDGFHPNDPRLYYGISMCSPEDNFSKSAGRAGAKDNLVSAKTSVMRGVYGPREYVSTDDVRKDAPAVVLREAVKEHLNKMRHRPSWISKGAKVEFRSKKRGQKKATTKNVEKLLQSQNIAENMASIVGGTST